MPYPTTCSEIIIFTIIFVVKSLKDFGWNNVGPASQTVALHYISIGPMYRVIWCYLSNIVHLSNFGSMLGQRRRRWPNIKTALDQCLV